MKERRISTQRRPSVERELRRELGLIRRVGCIIGDLLTHASERDNDDERGRLPGDLTLKWAQWASSALHAQAGIKLKTPIKRVEDDDDLDAMLSKFLRDVDPERRAQLLGEADDKGPH